MQNKWPGGLEVLIKHNGFISIYSHLGSVSHRITLAKTPVAAGELVGYVGHTGLAFGPHLISVLCTMGSPSIRHKRSACRAAPIIRPSHPTKSETGGKYKVEPHTFS